VVKVKQTQRDLVAAVGRVQRTSEGLEFEQVTHVRLEPTVVVHQPRPLRFKTAMRL
jgi:hypothetical protein